MTSPPPHKQQPDEQRTAFEQAGAEQPSSLVGEIVHFIVKNKYWWLIPIVLSLGALGLLLILAYSGAAPFIYTLF